ncbi:MAG: FkbM family methyltransferase, partial [bacterium]
MSARFQTLMGSGGKIAGEEILTADGELGLFAGAANDEVVHGTYRRTGQWAPELLELLTHQLLAKGGTLLDIGANIGLVTVPTTERTQCRTLAFEPDPRNAELLRRNVALHGLKERIDVHELALFSAAG